MGLAPRPGGAHDPDMSADASRYVIPPPPQAALAIAGSDKLFAVRRIWCVGRNYIDATPTSGTLYVGGGGESLSVEVKMRRVKE